MDRKFEDRPAKREGTPVFVGQVGASSSGKTYSALRLATGMQQVTGGEIYGIDTESNRMLHYADSFKFRHVPFAAPFSPLDYLAAIQHCVDQGASIVIVDSASHEHEGPGGLLEWHEKELDRMAGPNASYRERDRHNFRAWSRPKQAHQRLINTIVQLGVHAIFCFRAKQKLRMPKKGESNREPTELGWMPIGDPGWVYEMTVNLLLYPGSSGVPTWETTYPGERQIIKLPDQLAPIFAMDAPRPVDESMGVALAEWGRGGAAPQPADQDAGRPPSRRQRIDTLCLDTAERLQVPVEKVRGWVKGWLPEGETVGGLTEEQFTGLCEQLEALSLEQLP